MLVYPFDCVVPVSQDTLNAAHQQIVVVRREAGLGLLDGSSICVTHDGIPTYPAYLEPTYRPTYPAYPAYPAYRLRLFLVPTLRRTLDAPISG